MTAFRQALRGELLQLRKWPALRWILAAMPAYMLLANYLLYYVMTVTASPLQVRPSAYGISYTMSVLEPGQIVQVVSQYGYLNFGAPLAVVAGALVVGTGLERGTTRSAALTGAGWVRVLLAQGLAVCAVLVVSVVLTFAVSACASELAHVLVASPVPSTVDSFPPAGQLAHAMWVAMLVSICYGMVGCALAAITRSPGAAILLGLFFVYGFPPLIESFSSSTVVQAPLYEPENSVFTLMAQFGQPGGGGTELPNTPAQAAHILGAWTLGSALVFIAAASLRGKVAISRPRLPRLSIRARAPVGTTPMLGSRAGSMPTADPQGAAPDIPACADSVTSRWPGLSRSTTTLRSELFVLLRWPVVRALLLCLVLYTWLATYLIAVISYLVTAPADRLSVVPELGVSGLLPLLLSSLQSSYLYLWTGVTPLLLIGAWTGGTIWPGGQLRTRATQWQRRSEQVAGQCLALVLLATGAAVLVFAIELLSAKLIALALPHVAALQTGGRYGMFPSATHTTAAIGAYALAATTYALLGLAIGTALRNPAAALGAAFLWVIGVDGPLTQLLPQLHGTLLRVVEALPFAGLSRLTTIAGLSDIRSNPVATISVTTAVLQLAGWSAVAVLITTCLTHRSEHA